MVIACDKRHVRTILPIQLLSDKTYFRQAESKNIFQGILLGLVAIMLLYNFSLFIATKLSLYIWYGVYLSTVFVYFFAEMGYFFQYITPHQPSWNDVFPIGVIASSFIPFIIFINQMLELKKNQPMFFKINNGFLIGFSFILITGILVSQNGDFIIQEYWLKIYRVISPAFLLVLMMESLICLKKKIRFAAYTSLSILSLILMSAVYLLHDAGFLPMNMITSNAFIVGITIEICIMTIAIASRFESYKRESEQLAMKQEREKDQIIKTISDFKEKEMQRFSNMLHDAVGARLSAIRMNIEAIHKTSNEETHSQRIASITEDIGNLADEVRIFSHQLSPVLLEQKGLFETIYNLIKTVNRAGVIYIQFEAIGTFKKIPFHYQLLLYNIIQELIQNIIRHSNATEAIVQLMVEEEQISVYVEDNGKGFDKTLISEGLGLTQIKKLTGFVKGIINIESSASGTIISIEFNMNNNETIY
jgi:signal transduction histidine kinase